MSEEGRYYKDIGQLAECDLEQANVLLGEGWELLKIDQKLKFDAKGETSGSELVYILGKKRPVQQSLLKQPIDKEESIAKRSWEGAQWKPSMYDKSEYISSDDPMVEGDLVPLLERAPTRSLVLGGFSYKLSKDGRWISRVPVPKVPK